jgi:sugar phosphate isomerase/epimerase
MAMKIGTTTIPLAGWIVDSLRMDDFRQQRLDAIRRIVEGYGLSAVELSLDLGIVFPEVFDRNFYEKVAVLQKDLGFICTVHLPFMWTDCSSLNESIRQSSVESIRLAVELTEPIMVDAYVLHLWGSTTVQIATVLKESLQKQMILEAIISQSERSLEEICKLIIPLNLCVENLEFPSFDFIMPLIDQYGTSICLDVGHLAWQGGGEISFFDRHQNRIREIHLHDATIIRSGGFSHTIDHLPLGKGQIDYRAFLQRIDEVGFRDVLILENNTRTDLEMSIARVGDYLKP